MAIRALYCEYCGSVDGEQDKYHPVTCAHCGAPLKENNISVSYKGIIRRVDDIEKFLVRLAAVDINAVTLSDLSNDIEVMYAAK